MAGVNPANLASIREPVAYAVRLHQPGVLHEDSGMLPCYNASLELERRACLCERRT